MAFFITGIVTIATAQAFEAESVAVPATEEVGDEVRNSDSEPNARLPLAGNTVLLSSVQKFPAAIDGDDPDVAWAAMAVSATSIPGEVVTEAVLGVVEPELLPTLI
jgi:hypothetical protein